MLPLNEMPTSVEDSIKILFSIKKKMHVLVPDDTTEYAHAPERTPFDFYLRCQAQAGFQMSLCHLQSSCQASRDVNQQKPRVLSKRQVRSTAGARAPCSPWDAEPLPPPKAPSHRRSLLERADGPCRHHALRLPGLASPSSHEPVFTPYCVQEAAGTPRRIGWRSHL